MKSTLLVAAVLAVIAPRHLLVAQTAAPATSATPANPPATTRGNRTPPQLPPPGIPIPDADRQTLLTGVKELKREIDALAETLKGKPAAAFLPDVEIFHKAVDWPLRFNEFYNLKELVAAKKYLAMGKDRAALLAKGEHPWTTQTGLVVRGYRSKVDGSVQPYGLVVPASWKAEDRTPRKALVWLLGRGNNRTELAFLNERLGKPPEIGCPDGFTLIPYGRFCNATKFAGETDVFEALGQLRAQYPVDAQRIAVAGFSMGGASAWHLGAHYAGEWCAVSPGAGFAETREYAKVFAPGKTPPPWWEQTLWRWYDATEYAANLSNVPTLAYSGELDKQIQSAEIMKRFAEKDGVKIEHFIGPKTEHKYEPETRKRLQARLDEIWEKGRTIADPYRWVTYSLIYPGPHSGILKVLKMDRQWEHSEISLKKSDSERTVITTSNISRFQWNVLQAAGQTVRLKVDGQSIDVRATDYLVRFSEADPLKDGEKLVRVDLAKTNGNWLPAEDPLPSQLWKRPGICGPIDHAFMSSFVHVRPTGKPAHDTVDAWSKSELQHARGYWRQIFRGEAPVKDDTAVSDEDISKNNLVLWGDPSSNAVLKRIVGKLPLEWTREKLVFGGQNYDPAKTAPILIFPNPLNPTKYVVLNSGVTFRESAMGTNSQQTPKLPDWAIVDLDTPPGPDWPGKILQAGFFDENWKYTATQPK
jgi:dienelactone hydrolase